MSSDKNEHFSTPSLVGFFPWSAVVSVLTDSLASASEQLQGEYWFSISTKRQRRCCHSFTNLYTLGRIGEHNVVIACLPAGQIGNNSAAAVAMQMKLAFPSIRFGLMVGIGGGVPSEDADVRLYLRESSHISTGPINTHSTCLSPPVLDLRDTSINFPIAGEAHGSWEQ
jgi:hypothetical protein